MLTKEGTSPLKKSRTSKKTEIIIYEPIVKETKTSKSPKTKTDEVVSKAVIKPIELVVIEPTSVTIPSKTGVFRKLKLKYGGSPTSNVVHKPHLTHQGALMRQVPTPVSPHSKKRRAVDMAKKILKKKKKMKKKQLVIPMKSSEEEQVPETPEPKPIIQPTSPEKIVVIIPEVSSTKSYYEEVRTSDITVNVSDTVANVIMGEGDLTKETTQPPQGGFGGTFEDLAFDEEEEDFPDHMLMSMKQFKILNKKLNSIISSQADMGGGSSLSSFEVDGLMKACEARMLSKMFGMLKDLELRIIEKIDHVEHTTYLRINSFNSKHVGVVKELRNVQKERHTLFVRDVKKVREDVNLKLQELQNDMVREVIVVQNNYATLHKKFDIICDAITKYVTLYESLSPQITQLSTTEN
ncbi:unnamed protein product [Lactuca saligna]|uniref:Uncharacterized protein n=1 Tax=Lactuca saligna TaxID=75948 RepID=A0AA35YXV4_LACSI|nr:unnamed protein product [Lactuca saligna]